MKETEISSNAYFFLKLHFAFSGRENFPLPTWVQWLASCKLTNSRQSNRREDKVIYVCMWVLHTNEKLTEYPEIKIYILT